MIHFTNLFDYFNCFLLSFVGIKKMGSGMNAGNYYLGKTKDNQPTDYYTKDHTMGVLHDPNGVFETLGLQDGQQISEIQLQRLCAGLHPETGKPLPGLEKTCGDKHRAGVDIATAPPKTFSALWAVAQPELRVQLEAVRENANSVFLKYVNDNAGYTRTGHGGVKHVKTNLASIAYAHGANRENEPHPHDHNLHMNLTFRDGKWRAMEMSHIMDWQTSANAVYQSALVKGLHDLGFETEAIDHHFEVKGVPEDLVKHWSSRSEQIGDAAKEEGLAIDDLGGRDRLHGATRKGKASLGDNPHEEWAKEAAEFGFTDREIEDIRTAKNSPALTNDEMLDYIAGAVMDLHQTEAVFTENNFHRAVHEKLWGQDPEAIEEMIGAVKHGMFEVPGFGKILNLGEREGDFKKTRYLSTEFMKTIEIELGEMAYKLDRDGKHQIPRAIIEAAIAKYPGLSEEQGVSVEHVLSNGSLKVTEGAAGVGKTFSMQPVKDAFEMSGYKVYAVAQADSQKNTLAEELGMDKAGRRNLAEIFSQVEKGKLKLDDKTLLIVDECGLVGSESMNKLLKIQTETGCKVILTGEEAQLSPVGAGPAMQTVLNNVKSVSINTIRRQKDEWQREMVQDFRAGRAAEGLAKLDEHGQLRLHANRKSQMNALIDAWDGDRLKNRNTTQLILAVKNMDKNELNVMAHYRIRKSGDLSGPDIKITCDNKKGKTIDFPFAVGDKVVLNKKDKELEVPNKDAGTISNIKAVEGGYIMSVRLSTGRTVDLDTRQYVNHESKGFAVSHNYSTAKWPAQGLTVQKTYVMADMADRRYSYVGLSRHKESTLLFVNEGSIRSQIRERRKDSPAPEMHINNFSTKKEKSNEQSHRNSIAASADQRPARVGQGTRAQEQMRKLPLGAIPPTQQGPVLFLQGDLEIHRKPDVRVQRLAGISKGEVIEHLAKQMSHKSEKLSNFDFMPKPAVSADKPVKKLQAAKTQELKAGVKPLISTKPAARASDPLAEAVNKAETARSRVQARAIGKTTTKEKKDVSLKA